MDGSSSPPPSTSSSSTPSAGTALQQPPNLRSSVSMFIEDSRITAVANAEPPLIRPSSQNPSSSFYSVSSFSSSTSCRSTSGSGAPSFHNNPQSVLSRRASWNLRPNFSQIPPDPGNKPRPRACSSSPVRFRGGGNSPSTSSRGGSSSREIIHNIIREEGSSGAESTSGGTFSSYRPQLRPLPKKRTTLTVEPVISVINVKERLPPLPTNRRDDGRSYTSVNLTLRSPTTSNPCGGPTLITSSSSIPSSRRGSSVSGGFSGGGVGRSRRFSGDICGGGGGDFEGEERIGVGVNVVNTVVDMEAGGTTTFRHVHHSLGSGGGGEIHHHHHPTNLMYSTYSNSRDGFEAQVQIQFGPGGGTFTASRRRGNQNISIRQMNSDLLSAQNERKDKLRTTIHEKRGLLATLQTEIVQLRSQLQLRSPFHELDNLKKENQRLRIQCEFMTREVDLYQNGSVPLGETDEEFYEGINPGQSIHGLFGITSNRRRLTGGREASGRGYRGFGPPPRPPPPKFVQSPTREQAAGLGGGDPQHPHHYRHQQSQEGTATSPSGAGGGMGDGGGGGVDDEEGEEGEWTCSMCTFQNHRDLDYCEQCQMVRVKQPQSLHGTN